MPGACQKLGVPEREALRLIDQVSQLAPLPVAERTLGLALQKRVQTPLLRYGEPLQARPRRLEGDELRKIDLEHFADFARHRHVQALDRHRRIAEAIERFGIEARAAATEPATQVGDGHLPIGEDLAQPGISPEGNGTFFRGNLRIHGTNLVHGWYPTRRRGSRATGATKLRPWMAPLDHRAQLRAVEAGVAGGVLEVGVAEQLLNLPQTHPRRLAVRCTRPPEIVRRDLQPRPGSERGEAAADRPGQQAAPEGVDQERLRPGGNPGRPAAKYLKIQLSCQDGWDDSLHEAVRRWHEGLRNCFFCARPLGAQLFPAGSPLGPCCVECGLAVAALQARDRDLVQA